MVVAAAAVAAAAVGKCCADEKCLGEKSVEIKNQNQNQNQNPQSQEPPGVGVLGRASRGEVSSFADGQMGGSCTRTPTLRRRDRDTERLSGSLLNPRPPKPPLATYSATASGMSRFCPVFKQPNMVSSSPNAATACDGGEWWVTAWEWGERGGVSPPDEACEWRPAPQASRRGLWWTNDNGPSRSHLGRKTSSF